MLVAVVDSATPAITAAAVRIEAGGAIEVLAESVTVDGRAHGERLAPAIASVLERAGAAPADLTAIVVGLGPGPFTGLRVGLVTAATMSDALGIPAYGVCSLDGYPAPGTVLVAADARRHEIYWAVYRDGVRETEPDVTKPGDLVLPEGVEAAIGDGAHRYADVLGLPLIAEPRYPRPAALAAAAADRVLAGAPGEQLTPLYLRRPDAVEPGARKSVS